MKYEKTLAFDKFYITLICVFSLLIYTRTVYQPSLTPILSVAVLILRDLNLILSKADC